MIAINYINLKKNKTEGVCGSGHAVRNAALFLRLGLPSTLIRSFLKTFFKPEEFENAGFDFRGGRMGGPWGGRKHFENGTFRQQCRYDNHVISVPEFSTNTELR